MEVWDVLLRLWPEEYEIWRDVISDDDILPREPMCLDIDTKQDMYVTQPLTVACLLIAFYDKVSNFKYLNGRLLARMSSGRLAIVPASIQKGDIIAYFYKGSKIAREFLFRPLQLVDKHRGVDTKILNWTEDWETLSERFLEDDIESLSDELIRDRFLSRYGHP